MLRDRLSDTLSDSLRVTILWGGVSGYMAACWRALAARGDVRLEVVSPAPVSAAPFDAKLLEGQSVCLLSPDQQQNYEFVREAVLKGDPQVVVLPGWIKTLHGPRLAADKKLAGRRLVMFLDTPFNNGLRQFAGRFVHRSYFRRISIVIGASDRSRTLAMALGFDEKRIRTGCYGFDLDAFARAADVRRQTNKHEATWPRKFLFVGRYFSPDKGLDLLVEAYKVYRSSAANPWELICCGTGPDAGLLKGVAGITDLGFVQPGDQPQVMSECGAFFLPSRYEPWGVALAEAAGAGLPLVCSSRCAAGVDLVRSYFNGLMIGPEDVGQLARAMHWIDSKSASELHQMGVYSQQFARAFSADVWAARTSAYLHEALDLPA